MPLPAAPLKYTRRLAREDVYAQLSAWIIEGGCVALIGSG